MKEHNNLPNHLKPKAITTNVGLKTRVIRSLYHAYEPLCKKVLHETTFTQSLEHVEYKICESYWWKQMISLRRKINVWVFYFKLVLPGKQVKHRNIFKERELIKYNPEDCCCLLRITAPSFMYIGNISGLHLTSVNVSVSRSMQYHKVKLLFHEYRSSGKYINSQAVVIVIDPILDIQILKWWDPEYPHPFDN